MKKKNLFFVAFIFMFFNFRYTNAQKMNTSDIKELVNKICEFLENNDYEGLKQMVVESKTFSEGIFENMKSVHDELNYKKMYTSGYRVSQKKNVYTLGGHGDDTRHIHIEFHKKKTGWALQKIWVCR